MLLFSMKIQIVSSIIPLFSVFTILMISVAPRVLFTSHLLKTPFPVSVLNPSPGITCSDVTQMMANTAYQLYGNDTLNFFQQKLTDYSVNTDQITKSQILC